MSEQNVGNAQKLTPRLMGAAAAKLVAAGIGEISTVFSRSPAHKYYTFADMDWMILPSVFRGQFYVDEIENTENGLHAPIAVATWAFVSEEVDHRIRANPGSRIRLRPDEWTSGDLAWIVDLAGEPRGIRSALNWLQAGPFSQRDASLIVSDGQGRARIELLTTFAAPTPESAA